MGVIIIGFYLISTKNGTRYTCPSAVKYVLYSSTSSVEEAAIAPRAPRAAAAVHSGLLQLLLVFESSPPALVAAATANVRGALPLAMLREVLENRDAATADADVLGRAEAPLAKTLDDANRSMVVPWIAVCLCCCKSCGRLSAVHAATSLGRKRQREAAAG